MHLYRKNKILIEETTITFSNNINKEDYVDLIKEKNILFHFYNSSDDRNIIEVKPDINIEENSFKDSTGHSVNWIPTTKIVP